MTQRTILCVFIAATLFVVAYFTFAPRLEHASFANCTEEIRSVTFCDIGENSLWGRFGTLATSLILYVVSFVLSWVVFRRKIRSAQKFEIMGLPLLLVGIILGFIITGIGRVTGQALSNYLFGIIAPLLLSALLGFGVSVFPRR